MIWAAHAVVAGNVAFLYHLKPQCETCGWAHRETVRSVTDSPEESVLNGSGMYALNRLKSLVHF